jgi:hypothetical protein
MSRLSDEYERHAQWYEGIVAGLSGEDTRVFDELLASTEAELGRTTDEQKRAELERDARVLRASKPSIQRAREHGTSFFDELDKELRGVR